MNGLKIFLGIVVLGQCLLIAAGLWLIQQESETIVVLGYFNILANIVFGGINVSTLIRCQ